jgi:CRISP-associated protein Cas1
VKRPRYIFTRGTLSRRQNTLRYLSEGQPRFLPVEATSEIHLFGAVVLNTRVLNFLGAHGIPLHVYDFVGNYSGSYVPREQGSGLITLHQAGHYRHPPKRLALARRFLEGALRNLERVLAYYAQRGVELDAVREEVRSARKQVETLRSVEALMALEGRTRERYYAAWDAILQDPDFAFETRSRRPPKNALNALISFGNTMLYTTCLSEVLGTQLNPAIGFLHATNERAYSLNLDLAEIFKPIVVDRVIFTLVNKKMLSKQHFRRAAGGIYLNDDGRKIFLKSFDQRLGQTLTLPGEKRPSSYRYLIRRECYKLIKHLSGEAPYQPFVAPD